MRQNNTSLITRLNNEKFVLEEQLDILSRNLIRKLVAW